MENNKPHQVISIWTAKEIITRQAARITELEAENELLRDTDMAITNSYQDMVVELENMREALQKAQELARKFEDMYAAAWAKFAAGDPRPFALTGTTQPVRECTNEPHPPRP